MPFGCDGGFHVTRMYLAKGYIITDGGPGSESENPQHTKENRSLEEFDTSIL